MKMIKLFAKLGSFLKYNRRMIEANIIVFEGKNIFSIHSAISFLFIIIDNLLDLSILI